MGGGMAMESDVRRMLSRRMRRTNAAFDDIERWAPFSKKNCSPDQRPPSSLASVPPPPRLASFKSCSSGFVSSFRRERYGDLVVADTDDVAGKDEESKEDDADSSDNTGVVHTFPRESGRPPPCRPRRTG